MHRRIAAPGRLRRRLAVSFALVAGIATAALAIGTYVFVRETRLQDSLDRSERQARLNISFAALNLPREPTIEQLDRLLGSYDGGGFQTRAVRDGRDLAATTPSVAGVILPEDLRGLVAEGQIAFRRLPVSDEPHLVIGGPIPGSGVELYFFFSELELARNLRALAVILATGWAVVALVAAGTGLLLARRALEPVAQASRAARAVAEGLLDTRLPVEQRDEFGAWAASFNEMAEALEAKIAALSDAQERERRFTSDVSHELRTPLAALVSEASLLHEQLDAMPEDARRPAELLVRDVARLRRLVEDLMEISRLDAGREAVRLEPVDLPALVSAALRARGWEDRVRLETEAVEVLCDNRRLERIITNLVGNALEHGRDDVRVRVGQEGLRPFVEVSDRGSGIGSDHLSHLFDRFYKADPARTGPGSGLGLAIALENARLLEGDIEVWSEPGQGSRFTLRLPAVTESLPAREGHVSPGAQDEGVHSERRNL